MEALIDTIFNTEWGSIIIGIFLLTALLIELFNHKPKI